MKIPTTTSIVAALFLLLPCAAPAQVDPEVVYGKFHRAMLEGNIDEMNKYGTQGGGTEIAKLPAEQRKAVLDLLKKLAPQSYKITGRQLSPDGNRLTMRATGLGASLFGGKTEPQNGAIVLVKQGGEWKVDNSNWSSSKPHAEAPLRSAGPPSAGKAAVKSAPSAASERKLGAYKEPCVYKPVMTNEDMERCR